MIIDEGSLRVKWYDPEFHLGQLIALMKACFPHEEWKPLDFDKFMGSRARNNIIKVLVDDHHNVYGAMFYCLSVNTCRIRRIAVNDKHRRKGLATYMVHTLTGPRSPLRKRLFLAHIRESNFPAQALFHGKLNFQFDPELARTKVKRLDDEKEDEDMYVFSFEKAVARLGKK
jgi:hypothetical protein